MNTNTTLEFRGKCYRCNRPKSSCMCQYIHSIPTNTQFIILMHPKEHQKTKNGTGYLTHLSLPNSKVFRGIDFSNHTQINQLLNDQKNECYILYPSSNSINLSNQKMKKTDKQRVVFIIDSTWACSRKILRLSHNLQHVPTISFQNNQKSNFKIKTQPKDYCLSTIESTLIVIKLLNEQKIENIKEKDLNGFLKPFKQMVKYQLNCAEQNNLRENKK